MFSRNRLLSTQRGLSIHDDCQFLGLSDGKSRFSKQCLFGKRTKFFNARTHDDDDDGELNFATHILEVLSLHVLSSQNRRVFFFVEKYTLSLS